MNNSDINQLTDTEDTQTEKLLTIKKTIGNFLDREVLIDFFIEVVNKSSCINFERKNVKRYISRNRPSLSLIMDIDKAKKSYPKLTIEEKKDNRSKVMDDRQSIIHKEIISPFVELMSAIFKKIMGEETEYAKDYKDYIEKIFPHDFSEMKNKLNNFINLEDNKKDVLFIFSLASGTCFPPLDISMNEDTGFTLDFLI